MLEWSAEGSAWLVTSSACSCQNSLVPWRSFRLTAGSLKALEVKIESMGESISEGTVAAVLKQPGDAVEEDEPIMQIETDKVTIDVKAPEKGKLENLMVRTWDGIPA